MSARAFRVGLTGGIASGKSTAAKFFGALGVPILDSDQIAREVVEPGQPPLERLVERFGPSILTPDGHLDRPALREIVFSDPKARTDLEALTHPAIGAALEARSASAGGPYQILVIPLLVEKNLKLARGPRAGGRLRRGTADSPLACPRSFHSGTGASDPQRAGAARHTPEGGR